jgi:hypothetical protein
MLRRFSGLQGGQQLGANLLGDVDDGIDVTGCLVRLRRLVPAVELLAVKIDLEPSATDGRQGDGDFAIATRNDLGCQTGSLPEVASGHTVGDLQVRASFDGHRFLHRPQ